MAFTLRVIGHGAGACAKVENESEYRVFFCQLGAEIEKPTMYVRFPVRSYKGKRAVRRGRSKTHRHIVLDGERLSIRANVAPSDQTLTINVNKDEISTTPTAYDEHSLRWLPAIEDLAPGHGKLKPKYLSNPLDADPPLVAQLVLTQGRLGTNGVERLQVPFKKKGAKHRAELRAIAREILLELEILDDHFILESTPLDESAQGASNHMRFNANGKRTLEIVIGNEPENDIYEPVPPIVPIDVIDKAAAKEYDFYYDLCSRRPKDALYPHVSSRPNGGMFCSYVSFNNVKKK